MFIEGFLHGWHSLWEGFNLESLGYVSAVVISMLSISFIILLIIGVFIYILNKEKNHDSSRD